MIFIGLMVASLANAAAQTESSAGQDNLPDYLPRIDGAKPYLYRTVKEHPLYLFVMSPEPQEQPRAAVIFFFGGGWSGGTVKQFEPHCRYLNSRGVVGVVADYRVSRRHDSKIVDSVTDAFAAVDWVRSHAAELGIDANRIIAAGGSAGGHLAACTGIIPRPNAGAETLPANASSTADDTPLLGMVLFNPVISLTDIGDIAPANPSLQNRLPRVAGTELPKISPYDQVRADQPPVLILHGTGDSTVPFASVEAFQRRYREVGNRCQLKAYADQPHGFFNFGRNENKYFAETVTAMDEFLAELGVVEGDPQVNDWLRESNVQQPEK